MSPERKSRFDGAPHRVTGTYEDDAVTPEERARRRDPDGKANPDWEVSTDAVAVVEIGASVDPDTADGWSTRWVIAPQHGRLVVRALTIEPTDRATPPGGVTASLLRELSPALAADLAANTEYTAHTIDKALQEAAHKWIEEFGPEPSTVPKRGRPRLSDDQLADLAQAYLEEIQAGRGVLARLAARFEEPPSTIRDRIRIARTRGFLGPAPKQGAKGADPGPRLAQYRKQQEQGAEDE